MADDWSARQLCDDGACTGTIGPDGACKVCGKTSEGYVARGADADEEPEEPEDDEDAPENAEEDPAAPEDSPEDSGDEWDNRALCSDGACTGVIGDDGKCNVCGKAAA